VTDFTGRVAEHEHLRGMLAQGWDASAMPVAVVSGPPGIGKTMLALRVAHSLRPAFPDGQLYLQMAGASGRPRDAGEVLGDVLRALGTAPAAIPDGAEQRAALYRSRLADRRVLVVADDAVSARQVRPLLPGTAGCAVLVTSRSRLADLGGARLVPLEPLTGDEAVQMLGRIVGAERVAAEPQAADHLVLGCGLLPLAVRIAGAKLASGPCWPMERMASLIADERRRLDTLPSVTWRCGPAWHRAMRRWTSGPGGRSACWPRSARRMCRSGCSPRCSASRTRPTW
jgi:DNA polymerase III delta prime subunit